MLLLAVRSSKGVDETDDLSPSPSQITMEVELAESDHAKEKSPIGKPSLFIPSTSPQHHQYTINTTTGSFTRGYQKWKWLVLDGLLALKGVLILLSNASADVNGWYWWCVAVLRLSLSPSLVAHLSLCLQPLYDL